MMCIKEENAQTRRKRDEKDVYLAFRTKRTSTSPSILSWIDIGRHDRGLRER